MPLIVGVFNGEGPPVPIPNTEVKLTSADNTCLETDREDRSMPTQKTATHVAVFFFCVERYNVCSSLALCMGRVFYSSPPAVEM